MLRSSSRCALLLACSVGACGRVGVELLPLDVEGGAPAGDPWDALDAGAPNDAAANDGATLAPNLPVDASALDDGGAVDAGRRADAAVPADAGTPASCAGASVLALCWYLGASDQSCNQACASHGGFDPRALGIVGSSSQGGTSAGCAAVMVALGRSGTVGEGMRTDGNGFGCHLWPGGDLWWLDRPSFDPAAASPRGTGVRIACGCLR